MGGGGIDAFPPSTQYLTQLRRPSFDIYDIYVNCGFAVVTRLRDWHHIYWTCLDGREFVERETPKTFSSVCLVDHYATIVCNSFCIAATERSADEYDEPIFDTYVYRLDLNHHNETPFWQCVGRLQVDIASLDCDFVSTNNIVCRCNDGADPEEEGLVLARVARPANVDSDDIIEILISDHFKVQVVKLFPTNARYACAIATMQDEFIGAIVDLQSECTVWVTNIFKSRLDMWMRNLRVTDTTALLSVVDVGDTASKEEFIVPFVVRSCFF